jgi:hypothetical protein
MDRQGEGRSPLDEGLAHGRRGAELVGPGPGARELALMSMRAALMSMRAALMSPRAALMSPKAALMSPRAALMGSGVSPGKVA